MSEQVVGRVSANKKGDELEVRRRTLTSVGALPFVRDYLSDRPDFEQQLPRTMKKLRTIIAQKKRVARKKSKKNAYTETSALRNPVLGS